MKTIYALLLLILSLSGVATNAHAQSAQTSPVNRGTITSKQVQLWWELKVKPGKADALRTIAAAAAASNLSEEPNTLTYNLYMNKDETLLTFVESYSDADAFRLHAERFAAGPYAGPIFECAEPLRAVLYGPVPQSLLDWLMSKGFQSEVHPLIAGFFRLP
jgi:quinol monooxygenase YgiN